VIRPEPTRTVLHESRRTGLPVLLGPMKTSESLADRVIADALQVQRLPSHWQIESSQMPFKFKFQVVVDHTVTIIRVVGGDPAAAFRLLRLQAEAMARTHRTVTR
jgi:hypothetical protein